MVFGSNINTGSSTVDQMAELNITGNIIPHSWYKTIKRETGKPYLLAMMILSDIVYWFRPVEIRDESTGQFIGWKKKFSADKLQRSSAQFAEMLGETKRNVLNALSYLSDLGVIKKELRTVVTKTGSRAGNVMFIDLDVDVLKKLTFPEDSDAERNECVECVKSESSEQAISDSSLLQVKESVSFDDVKEFFAPGLADDVVSILTEAINSSCDFVKIKGDFVPGVMVRRQLRNITPEQFKAALLVLGDKASTVKDFKAYALSVLYSAASDALITAEEDHSKWTNYQQRDYSKQDLLTLEQRLLGVI